MRLFLAAALTFAVLPGPAFAGSSTVHQDALIAQRALALARILNRESLILGDARSDAQVLALIEQMFSANADLAALEKEHPGVSREMTVALLPIINRSTRERLPQLWERQAALYARTFTAVELDTLIAFYSSPTGQKLIRVMQENMQTEHSLAELKKDGEFNLSANSVLADVHATGSKIVGQMDDADKAALGALMASGLLTKLKALALPTQQIALDWYDESAPGEDEETERVLAAIIDKYQGKQP